MFRVALLFATVLCASCSTSSPHAELPAATSDLTVADTVPSKLAPQPGTDPTLLDPMHQPRCDFTVDLPVDVTWFAPLEDLTADGRIAMARAVLGPSAACRRLELVKITVNPDARPDTIAAHRRAEQRADKLRAFFSSRGVPPDRIETRVEALASANPCPSSASCGSPHIGVEIRGVAR